MDELSIPVGDRTGPRTFDHASSPGVPDEDEELEFVGHGRRAGGQERTDEAVSDTNALPCVGDHDPEFDRVVIGQGHAVGVTQDLLPPHSQDSSVRGVGGEHELHVHDVRRCGERDEPAVRGVRRQFAKKGKDGVPMERLRVHDPDRRQSVATTAARWTVLRLDHERAGWRAGRV